MNEQLSIRRAGDRAVLAVFRTVSLAELQWAAAEARSLTNVEAVVIGHSSLLVLFDPRATDAVEISSALQRNFRDARVAGRWVVGPRPTAAAIHEIEVSFAPEDAPDLPDFLAHAGMTRDEFLSRIRAVSLRARYLGFRPGFAYLEGLPSEWWYPRRKSSRTRVPAGSFAVAGEMAGFYPTDSPGGWNLLGRTSVELWDPAREQPNLIAPGDEILIRPVSRLEAERRVIEESAPGAFGRDTKAVLATVRRSGQLSLIVLPRNERRYDSALAPGGRFDEAGAAAVNRAIGNPPDVAVLECAMVGPTLAMHHHTILSWWGAEVSIRVNGNVIIQSRLFEARAGDVVEIGVLRNGLRGYLAMSGGIETPGGPYDLSPHVVREGETIETAAAHTGRGRQAHLEQSDRKTLRAMIGPHDCDRSLIEILESSAWTVTTALDRTGIRMRSSRAHGLVPPADLQSCGVQFGTVQFHPNGDLVTMGPDHPSTGGYLQVLTVLTGDLWKLGQLMPGDEVTWAIKPP